MYKFWPGARLPENGESSYCLVLKGLDLSKFNKEHPKRRVRRALRATRPGLATCLRRYYLATGNSKANNTAWSYPPGQPIRPNPKTVYCIPDFASFFDASEAFLYASVLKAYLGVDSKVLSVIRG